ADLLWRGDHVRERRRKVCLMQSGRIGSSRDSDRQLQIEALDQFASKTAYHHWVPAQDWVAISGGPSTVAPTASTPTHVLFSPPSSGTTAIYYYLSRPENWHKGHVEPVIHYGASVAGNYKAYFGYAFVQNNTAMPSFAFKGGTLAVPASGTSRILTARPKETLDTTFRISSMATGEINPKPVGAYAASDPPHHDGLYFALYRNSTEDSNIGSLRVYG